MRSDSERLIDIVEPIEKIGIDFLKLSRKYVSTRLEQW